MSGPQHITSHQHNNAISHRPDRSSSYQALREGELWHGFGCLQIPLRGLPAPPIAVHIAVPSVPEQRPPFGIPGLSALIPAQCHTPGVQCGTECVLVVRALDVSSCYGCSRLLAPCLVLEDTALALQ